MPAEHSNTWVDDQNNLHVRLEKIDNNWYGAMLESRNTVKYGKLTWVSSSPSLNLERNTTFGLCTYHDNYNELDIEMNQWPGYDQHVFFSKQPASIEGHPENIFYGVFSSNPHLNDKNIVYSIEWTPDYVYYSAIADDGTIIQDWIYSNPEGIPSINSTICMCLLPLAGSYYPASGNAAEIVLSSFTYTPYDSSGTESVQKPVVSFWGSKTSGDAPLTVDFTDESTNTPTAWNWNFGDGNSSTVQNPTHTYSNAGTYTVTLTASNKAGSGTSTKVDYITVTKPVQYPVNNNLNWNGITWYVPSDYSNAWVDDQNNLHMRLEKINDKWYGSLLESRNTVKYGKLTWVSSSPSLNLERNTTFGLCTYHDDTNELDIQINQWPGTDQHLYFANQPGSVDNHPENISYGVFSSNPHLNDKNIVYSIEWTPDYVYYSAIADDGTIIQDWTYSNPEGIPAVNSTICMDLLPLAGSYYPASGNAAEIVLSSFTYTPYNSSGTESVQKPVVSFWGSKTSGDAPLTVDFTDESTNTPTAWNWNFGDGNSSTVQNPTHTYSNAGTYTVTLTASNKAGSGTSTKVDYITVTKPMPDEPVVSEIDVSDNRLREASPNIVYKTSTFIDVGGMNKLKYRDVIGFNLSEYNSDSQITSVALSLYWYYPAGKTRNQDTIIEVYRPASSWNASYVSWNKRDKSIAWKTPGGDWYDKNGVLQGSTPYATITLKGSSIPDNKYYELDVTDLVKEYTSGKYKNTGFLIKARTESNNYIAFYSSECGNEKQVPKLQLVYN